MYMYAYESYVRTCMPAHTNTRARAHTHIHMHTKVVSSLGFELECDTNKALAESLNTIHCAGNPMANKLVRILATRCMSQAVYFASGDVASSNDFVHYGLAAPLYTHFTSPIRRCVVAWYVLHVSMI